MVGGRRNKTVTLNDLCNSDVGRSRVEVGVALLSEKLSLMFRPPGVGKVAYADPRCAEGCAEGATAPGILPGASNFGVNY